MSPEQKRPSPYQGLTPFYERDAPYFFGRDRDIRLISADLFANAITVLYGASGVGKSSVLRAGVVPYLRAAGNLLVVVFSAWQVDPASRLKDAVDEAVSDAASAGTFPRGSYIDELQQARRQPLADYLGTCFRLTRRRLMLILDQFEEYSLYHHEDDEFGVQFPALTNTGDLSVSVLLSIREESLGGLDRFRGRIRNLLDNGRRVDYLDVRSGREAIELPLRKYHEDYPTDIPNSIEPALVELVLDEVIAGRVQIGPTERGTLPMKRERQQGRIETPYLQLVMTRLWQEERRSESQTLRAETLSRLGFAQQIVQSHLDEVMSRFSGAQQDIAAQAFRLLVTPSGTKIAYSVRDLAETMRVDREGLLTVLEGLASGSDRILRPVAALPVRPNEARYEIFHDRLAGAVLDWVSRHAQRSIVTPISRVKIDEESAAGSEPSAGIALCLSGGGYKAMLFHAGALWRLNEIGILHQLNRIASVSTSSIAAAFLGRAWRRLDFMPGGSATNFVEEVIQRIRLLAATTIDTSLVLKSIFTLQSGADGLASRLAAAEFFGSDTLQDLPVEPRFIIVATNVHSGTLWRFQRFYMGDYRIGRVRDPSIPLAIAVAASSALPPILSPFVLKVQPADFVAGSSPTEAAALSGGVYLTDGSVVDKLAIETTWKACKTILVSEAFGRLAFQSEPSRRWDQHLSRVFSVVDTGLVSLRRRQITRAFQDGERAGTYWGIECELRDYGLPDALEAAPDRVAELAEIPARLKALEPVLQERLINWGYAICDTAIRRHFNKHLPRPKSLPYPSTGI